MPRSKLQAKLQAQYSRSSDNFGNEESVAVGFELGGAVLPPGAVANRPLCHYHESKGAVPGRVARHEMFRVRVSMDQVFPEPPHVGGAPTTVGVGEGDAPLAVLAFSASGACLGANGAARLLFGPMTGDTPGDTDVETVAALLGETDAAVAVRRLLGGSPDGFPRLGRAHLAELRNARGATFEALIEAVPLRNPVGSGDAGFLAVIRATAPTSGAETDDFSEERIGNLAAVMPGIVFQRMMLGDGSVSYPFVSPAIRDLLGYDPDDLPLTAEGGLDFIHWADRDAHMAAVRESADRLAPSAERFRAITREGAVKWLSGRAVPQRIAADITLWDGVLIDITDGIKAEQSLEAIMENVADGILTVGDDGLIQTANLTLEKMFRWPVQEAIGRPVNELLPEFGVPLGRDLTVGEDVGGGQRLWRLQGIRKDGSVFPAEVALTEMRAEGGRIFILIVRDIGWRLETERRLLASETRMTNMAANIPGIVFQRRLGADGRMHFPYISEGAAEVLGIDAARLMEDPETLLAAMDEDDRLRFTDDMIVSARTMQPSEIEFRVVTGGVERWLQACARPQRQDNGDVLWDGIALDITRRKEAESRLRFLAYFDPLTGLKNWSCLAATFETVKQWADQLDSGIAVLSVGLDRFGMVNASLGHLMGDRVLAEAAQRIAGSVPNRDHVARLSGDRFVCLVPGIGARADMEPLLERLAKAFEEPLGVDGQAFDLSASVGISVYPADGRDADHLIQNAEAALFKAKARGSAQVQFYSAEMLDEAKGVLAMQSGIRRALELGEFVAHFQPQLDVISGRIVGLEALARWQSSEHGRLIGPDAFISIAEESGLIEGIAEQVLIDACERNRDWQAGGAARIPVAVNISARQFQNPRRLFRLIETVLDRTGLDPDFLEIELTESSAMSDPDSAIDVVSRFREMGIRCAIDDFGTGYSSLAVLKRFPLSKLKIDRTFVHDVTRDSNDAAIVAAIIAMAQALNLDVIAEGVETIEDLGFLRHLGCGLIQGYLVSKPLPAEEMSRFFGKDAYLPKLSGPPPEWAV